MTSIKHIGLLTSGGDSPGMNACIRAVVRSAIGSGLKVSGVNRGYQGLIEGDFQELNARSVSNIIQRGGTILKSARSQEFLTLAGRERAYKNLSNHEIDGLVVIGGDGTFRGAEQFRKEFGIRSVGVPGTIDNDLSGTEYTLGFDTAVNTAVDAIDRIRDTAASHDRLFFVEVMGRHAGHIALHAGICSGAEAILMPETPTDIPALVNHLAIGRANGKTSNIVIVCEGDEAGGAFSIAQQVRSLAPEYDTKVTVLGHVQRGGAPSAFDRLLGTRFGVAAVEGLLDSRTDVMVGLIHGKIIYSSYSDCINEQHGPDPELLRISGITSI
jgi:6-phosphofructokinase 1